MSTVIFAKAVAPAAKSESTLVLASVLMALFLVAMDSTVVGTLLPAITADVGDTHWYPWLMTSFIMSSVVMSPLAGSAADRFGEKVTMLSGLTLFLAGVLMAYFSKNMLDLVVSRSIQGLGAGAVITLCYTMIGRMYGPEQRGKMQGLLSAVWGLAAISGPLVGALIDDLLSWRWVFMINVPLVTLVMLTIFLQYKSADQTRSGKSFNLLANLAFSVTLISALCLLMIPAIGGRDDFLLHLILVFLAGIIVYVLRVVNSPRRDVLPRAFVQKSIMFFAAVLSMIAAIALYASVTLLPLYQHAAGQGTSIVYGTVVLASAMGWVVGSAISGSKLNAVGFRKVATVGAILLCLGTALLAFLPPLSNMYMFVLAQSLIGLGIGASATVTLVLIQNSASVENFGRYTSSAQLFRNVGAAFGINAMAAVQIYLQQHGEIVTSFRTSFMVLFVITMLSPIAAIALPNNGAEIENTNH